VSGVPLPEEHDHDEYGNCLIPNELLRGPVWRFSFWDVLGVAMHTVGGALHACSAGSHALAQEFAAMANWSRNRSEYREQEQAQQEARREMAQAYERLVYGPEPGEPS
jgi:hypothetical protein